MEENIEVLYYDQKGKPCGKENAALCVIREIDKSGKVIKETEVEIYDEK